MHAASQEHSRRSWITYLLGTSLGAAFVSFLYPVLRYVVPPALEAGRPGLLSLRPLHPAESAILVVKGRERVYHRERHRKVFPSSMLRVALDAVPEHEESLEVAFEQADRP